MRIIHWIVFAYLSVLVNARYRFRFHTCIEEDQSILDRENLVSLRQMAFIDDGSLSSYKRMRLAEIGIGIEHGSKLRNFTKEYTTGAESALRVIEFYGSDRFIVINFWTRSYYFLKKGDKFMMRSPAPSIKPNFEHFVRVYFICAPGNARSALILFGEQAKLRSVQGRDGDSGAEPNKKKSKREEPNDMETEDEFVGWIPKSERQKRGTRQRQYPFETEVEEAVPNKKDDRRTQRRSSMFNRIAFIYVHFGFGCTILVNCILLYAFFHFFKNVKPIQVDKCDKDGGVGGGEGKNTSGIVKQSGTTTTNTKTN